ncbi:MAG: serine--tRNA ligase, partial [Planctomycetota bacterium]|nr:serine--tRNA ligase [Planctomycetota bacterium]
RLDAEWTDREIMRETLRQRRRRISEEVARAKDAGAETAALEAMGRQVGDELAALDTEMATLEARRQASLEALPNLPATDTPDQIAETQAPSPPWQKPFAPLHHADLVEMLGLAATAATAGHGFLIWRGQGARLIRALTSFMLDVHTREFGYEEVRAPALATRAALGGSAHLPALEDKMYAVTEPAAETAGDAPTAQDLFLSPRAEPHLAGLFAGEILEASRLPVRHASAGPAFRREAGGRGAAGRGLVRLHEFDTVELYVFAAPEQAEAELANAVAAADAILARLEVPHRRRLRPAPNLSLAAAKTIDLEVWAPGMKQWLAVAALSTFTDYQARRTDTRYRDAGGRVRLVHTLGGAAVALPHLVAALLENGQEADGSVRLPAALTPYFGEKTLHA